MMQRGSGLMPDDEGAAPNGDQMDPNRTPPAMGEAPEEEDEAESNVSPEEQDAYDQFVGNAYKLMYSPKSMPAVLKALEGNGNFVDGLAHTTVTVLVHVHASAKQSGETIPPDVLMHGGVEILENLAETAEKAGIHDYTDEEMEAATLRAMDLAREKLTQSGDVDPKVLKTEFAALLAADRQGRLEEFVPGAGEFAKRAQAAPEAGEGEEPEDEFEEEPEDEEEA